MGKTLSLEFPDSIHKQLQELAAQDGVSLDQFVSTAVAEKIAALATAEYLEQRAQKGDKARFHAALQRSPDVEPDADDRLPAE